MGFFSRLFGRKPEPPRIEDRRVMNEDWRVGDLAKCLAQGGTWDGDGIGPQKFEVMRVIAVLEALNEARTARVYGLKFREYPGSFVCTNFRKIRPDAEPCEEEFAALIKRGRKVPSECGAPPAPHVPAGLTAGGGDPFVNGRK